MNDIQNIVGAPKIPAQYFGVWWKERIKNRLADHKFLFPARTHCLEFAKKIGSHQCTCLQLRALLGSLNPSYQSAGTVEVDWVGTLGEVSQSAEVTFTSTRRVPGTATPWITRW